jgi:hypothetical protein
MGHAHHFLSRLDRVSLPHAELALGLYNDAALLRYILFAAHVPERAERVAISLDHPERGPFIVVTREGRFVTCLGEGMSVHDLPVISRAQLDAMAGRIGALRTKLDECAASAGPGGAVQKMLRRMHDAADELSREDMTALAGLAPLYAFELFKFLFDAVVEITDAREIYGKALKRTDRLGPQYRDALHAFHRTYWSIGHYAVLIGVNGPRILEQVPAEIVSNLDKASLSWGAVRQGSLPLAVRGIWAVAQIGEPLFASTRERFRVAATPLTYLDSAMGLAAIGLRHPHLLAEVREVLAEGPARPEDDPLGKVLHAMHAVLMRVLDPDPEAAAGYDVLVATFGAELWQRNYSAGLPRDSPLRFPAVTDVPEDLARAVTVNTSFDFLSHPTRIMEMCFTLPWVAHAPPEMLYFPRAVVAALRAPWKPEHTLAALRAHRDYYKVPQARPEGPARKGPCPCGSGKKYKRCCEAEGEASEAG